VVTLDSQRSSARRDELLERAYAYVLAQGLADMSLRPLAAAVGSSPRVLLFLFGSKEGLVRALLGRARDDELALLDHVRATTTGQGADRLGAVVTEIWRWLAADEHRALLALWVEAYARSLADPTGPWAGYARATVSDWLDLLAAAQLPSERRSRAGEARRTLALAVLRGALLDLLATGEVDRVTRAVHRQVRQGLRATPP
jgi:AcrR family transcriptional regulator